MSLYFNRSKATTELSDVESKITCFTVTFKELDCICLLHVDEGQPWPGIIRRQNKDKRVE
ncbi:hypothetical protein PP707_03375 [Acetobacter pasteurianus]|nr:hypothetical protein [Acetobacter pasteurianus]